ncbi:MAG TPA: iron ABC transporter substrate-binding protein [Gaiellaceae bacterium]|nr:iron ABC transporter substrate-binding protein [Gaiellaceae bacterium]
MCTRVLATGAAALLLVVAAACGGNDDDNDGASASGDGGTLVVYSGREEELVAPLFELFEEETGIAAEVRYGDSAELAATIAEEGGNSPADVFFAQDPGALGAVEGEGLLAELPEGVLDRVPERYRDPDGHWVGTSGRARVLVYNTDAVPESELPASVFDLVDPAWEGRIGMAPTNGSFQAFVTTMRLTAGDERTRDWLEGIQANDPMLYDGNTPIVEAAASGEVDVGLVNHYYLYVVRGEQPDAPIENHYFSGDDPGALVSVAGAAILDGAEHRDAAERFLEFLLSDSGQEFYADAAESEFPLVEGVEGAEGLPPLESLEGPLIELDRLGPELQRTLELLNEVGFTT